MAPGGRAKPQYYVVFYLFISFFNKKSIGSLFTVIICCRLLITSRDSIYKINNKWVIKDLLNITKLVSSFNSSHVTREACRAALVYWIVRSFETLPACDQINLTSIIAS